MSSTPLLNDQSVPISAKVVVRIGGSGPGDAGPQYRALPPGGLFIVMGTLLLTASMAASETAAQALAARVNAAVKALEEPSVALSEVLLTENTAWLDPDNRAWILRLYERALEEDVAVRLTNDAVVTLRFDGLHQDNEAIPELVVEPVISRDGRAILFSCSLNQVLLRLLDSQPTHCIQRNFDQLPTAD